MFPSLQGFCSVGVFGCYLYTRHHSFCFLCNDGFCLLFGRWFSVVTYYVHQHGALLQDSIYRTALKDHSLIAAAYSFAHKRNYNTVSERTYIQHIVSTLYTFGSQLAHTSATSAIVIHIQDMHQCTCVSPGQGTRCALKQEQHRIIAHIMYT